MPLRKVTSSIGSQSDDTSTKSAMSLKYNVALYKHAHNADIKLLKSDY